MPNALTRPMEQPQRLHAIRGFASLYVVLYHAKFVLWCGGQEYLKAFPRENWGPFSYLFFALDLLSSAGQQIVVVFFVLSGFFITRSLEARNESPLSFYKNRVLRIHVPFIASALLSVLVLLLLGHFAGDLLADNTSSRELTTRLRVGYEALSWKNFALSLLFLKDREYIGFNFAYWSLLYEGLFYLMIPFLRRRVDEWFLLSCAICALSQVVPAAWTGDNLIVSYFFRYNIFFALGALLATRHDLFLQWSGLEHRSWPCRLLITLAFPSLLLLALLHHDYLANLVAGLAAVPAILWLPRAELGSQVVRRVTAFFEFTGRISYSLYITHLPTLLLCLGALQLLTGESLHYTRWYPLGAAAALLFSWPFFLLVEKPSLRLLQRRNAARGGG